MRNNFSFQSEPADIATAAEAAKQLGDISSDEGVNDGPDKPNIDDNLAGAGGCDFDLVICDLLTNSAALFYHS